VVWHVVKWANAVSHIGTFGALGRTSSAARAVPVNVTWARIDAKAAPPVRWAIPPAPLRPGDASQRQMWYRRLKAA